MVERQPASSLHASDDMPVAQALELCSDGMLLLDRHNVITHANGLAVELLRCALPALAGADFWEVLSRQLAEQHEAEATRQLAATGAYSFLDADVFGGRWIEYKLRDHLSARVVTVRNVSDRYHLARLLRDAEQRNQPLFVSNPNVMWLFDVLTQQVLAANDAAQDFYQYSADEFLSLTARRLYASELASDVRGSVPVLDHATSSSDTTRVCKHRRKDGQVLVVEVASRLMEWHGQQAILMAVTDITSRYAASARLRQANAELEAQLKANRFELESARQDMSALTYALSHDLQAPLHTIDGFARTLAGHAGVTLDEPGRHYLERIQASVLRLSRLLESLKLMSRVSRSGLNAVDVDLSGVCQAIGAQLADKYPDRQVALEIAPGMVCVGDPQLLTVAMAALLDNAWKFTARKPQAWISVGLSHVTQPGEQVVCVADNGTGFDEAYAHKLFGNFQRLHSSADFPGTGLGLAIVRRIVTRHGGRVWAESTAAGGASFYIALPTATLLG